jgi:N-acetylmuramoyl-L-alanine amidase
MAQPRRRAHGWGRGFGWLFIAALSVWACLTLTSQLSSSSLFALVTAPTLVAPTLAPVVANRNTPIVLSRIGIISGHNRVKVSNGATTRDLSGVPDPGAVCEEPVLVKEADITWEVANKVAAELREKDKLTVELLGEFDRRLPGYYARALVSIHVDSCIKGATGFKVARLIYSAVPAEEDRFVSCLREQYTTATGLVEHRASITPDMQEYHALREIAPSTPGVIIELGFLHDDQELLVKRSDIAARGVVEGIRCFLGRK